MIFRLSYSEGQFSTYPLEDHEVEDALRWGSVIELTGESLARYERHLEECRLWDALFHKADNEAYAIRYDAGHDQKELIELEATSLSTKR